MAKAEQMTKSTEIVITRIFDAPRELVWKAWTVPEYFMRWWGPKDFTAPVIEMHPHVGGGYLWCMRSPEGQDFWSTGEYREVVPMERIVYTDSFSDEKGTIVPASHYGMSEDWPVVLPVTVTFEELDGRTRMTLREAGIPASENREMAEAGWNESLDKLARVLEEGEVAPARTNFIAEPGKQEVIITSIFDAPQDLVFKACSDPQLLSRWWGPKNRTTTVETMNAHTGGIWRFVQRDADGTDYAYFGVFHEVTPPERLIHTSEFEGRPGHVLLATLTFEELNDGRTKRTDRSVFQTVEDRDAMLAMGMELDTAESMDRLAELLDKMKAPKQAAPAR